MKKTNKIIILIALIILTIFTLKSNILAVDPGYYDPSTGSEQDNGTFYERAGIILGWIQYIGILVSVVALSIIGIKYLFSSVEGKAEYKKTMWPYILGCFLLMGASLVVGLIADLASDDTGTVSVTETTSCKLITDLTKNEISVTCINCKNKIVVKHSNYIPAKCSNCERKFAEYYTDAIKGTDGVYRCGYCNDTVSEEEFEDRKCTFCKCSIYSKY